MDEHGFTFGHAEGRGEHSGPGLQEQVKAIVGDFTEELAPVAVIVATREERMVMEECSRELTTRGIAHQFHELSPHRDAARLAAFVDDAAVKGIRVIIASGGTVPSMPAFVAAHTSVPVIGVPLSTGALGGLDALLATVQSGPGIPVACMAVDGIRNSAIYASHILNAIPMPPR